jgi:hypothetical protein
MLRILTAKEKVKLLYVSVFINCVTEYFYSPPHSYYYSFRFVTPIQLMVIRSNMVTVFKLKHPCIRCCEENTFIIEESNSQKSIWSLTVLP